MTVYMAPRLIRHLPGLVDMDGAPQGCVGVFLVFSNPSVAQRLLGLDVEIYEMDSDDDLSAWDSTRKPEREGNVVDMWQWRLRKGR